MKIKKFLCLILTFIFILVPTAGYAEPAANTVKLVSKSAVLMEFSTGKIVFESNAHQKLTPASVTKVMTMLLVMEAVDSGKIKLTDKVVASARAKSMGGSTMYLDAGEVRTVEELIKAVAVESANDAAIALAEFMDGTEEGFVEKMNQRAKELKMNDTHFSNCTGLYPDNHYTSAYDIAIMSRELLKHSKILNYTTIWQETISAGRDKPFTLTNRNKMLKSYKGCDGLKTGFITEAMYCMSATAKRGDMRFIAVIMGAPTWKERNAEAGKLLDIGFAKYESIKVAKQGDVVDEITIPKAQPDKIRVMAKSDLNVIVEKGSRVKLDKKVEIFKNIKLPIKKGDTIGVIKAVDGNKVYAEVPVVAGENIRKTKLTDTISKTLKSWLDLK